MKTAMQELITHLEMLKNRVDVADIDSIIEYATNALEKEKEQIMEAMERTAMYVSVASIDKEIGKMTIEDLYNQTYDQNK